MAEWDAAWERIVGEFILPGHAEVQERPSGLFVARDTLLGDLVADEARRAGADPYAWDDGLWLTDFKVGVRSGFAAVDPRAQMKVIPISYQLDRDLVLVLEDPAERWASSWREFGRQLVDIVRHERAVARGRPELSPGARWVTGESVVDNAFL